jgi:hypothetical protein
MTIRVYYAGLLHSEPDIATNFMADLPDGAYVRSSGQPSSVVNWYRCQHASTNPIPINEVPAELRMLDLLLS